MKLRNRDVAAAVLFLVLSRMAWTDNFGPESLTTTVNLAFYAPFRATTTNPRKIERSLTKKAPPAGFGMAGVALTADLDVARPVPLDVDGDGTVEAIVIPAVLKNSTVGGEGDDEERIAVNSEEVVEWGLRVLDLKPMHAAKTAGDEMAIFPFSPRVMFESKPVVEPPVGMGGAEGVDPNAKKEEADEADRYLVPLRMSTGQLYLNPNPPTPSGGGPNPNFVESDDRTRHYFCGKDWQDAAHRCGTPCKSGTATDCPDGEQCYADTPCDAAAPPTPAPTPKDGEGKGRVVLVKTPGGGMPSVVTAWSDGSVTLHAVTGEYNPAERRKKKKAKKRKAGEPDPGLELRLMWRSRPFKEDEKKEDKAKEDGEEKMEGEGENGDEGKKPDPSTRWRDSQEEAAKHISFKELDLTLDPDAPLGKSGHGAVLFAARYLDGASRVSASYFALDAGTGEVLWSHRGRAKPLFPWMDRNRGTAKKAQPNSKEEEDAKKRLEDEKRLTGLARRRSHLADILGAGGGGEGGDDEFGAEMVDDVLASEDCLVKYRHWILDPSSGALPHLHWGGGTQDARIGVAHFDRRHHHEGRRGGGGGALQHTGGLLPSLGKKKKKGGTGGGTSKKSRPAGDQTWQKKMLVAPRRKTAAVETGPGGKKGQHHKHRRGHGGPGRGPIHAKPNVLLFHHEDGLSVLSLRNGRPVCHLSLVDDSLYDDLNGDGIIDQVQILRGGTANNLNAFRNAAQGAAGIMGRGSAPQGGEEEGGTAEERKKESAKFAGDLVERIMKEGPMADREGSAIDPDKKGTGTGVGSLCHAMVLSGLPAREKVFHASLCDPAAAEREALQRQAQEEPEDVAGTGGGRGRAARGAAARARARRNASNRQLGVGAAPPLPVETLDVQAPPGERDVVFAVGTGSVSRYNPHGVNMWTTARKGPEEGGLPTWGGDAPARFGRPASTSPAHLARINFTAAYRAGSPAVRPVLVAGEDGLAILSAGRGRVLASASYPQAAASRPLLADVSGDGTSDLIVVSADGVWGYKVRVETGGSRFLRVAVGLLLLGIGVAALRNKFGQPHGVDKRSTDF